MAKTALEKKASFEWDERKERAFQMTLRGYTKVQIAEELGVSRQTIHEWANAQAFWKRLDEERYEIQVATRHRRLRATTVFGDRVTSIADAALKRAEREVKKHKGRVTDRTTRTVKEYLGQFRDMREVERVEYGENVQKHAIVGAVQHNHSGAISSSANQSFKSFLTQQLESGVVNAELVAVQPDMTRAVIEAMQQSLTEGELLREFDREDGKTPEVIEAQIQGKDA